MQLSRIAELLAPFLAPQTAHTPKTGRHSEPARSAGEEPAVLSSTQLQAISTYIDLLLRWNARINLTAIRDPEQIVTRHFGESLFAAQRLFPSEASVGTAAPGCPAEQSCARAADIGSGAGFPGIPIKLWQQHLNLTLIESNHKKAAFLREVVRALQLTTVEVISDRAETLAGRTFDLVTLRAVEKMEGVLPVAAKSLAVDGRLVLFVSSRQIEGVRASLALKWEAEIPVPESDSRRLLIGVNQPSK